MGAPDRPDPTEAKLLGILEAIRSLTPPQRRRLMRRLRVSGLLASDEYLSDRNRLRVAPALNAHTTAESQPRATPKVRTAEPLSADSVIEEESEEANLVDEQQDDEAQAHSQGDDQPADGDEEKKPALDGPIEIVYDGGTREGSEQSYGAYAIRWPGEQQENVQLRFGEQTTSDEAEYDTLIAALEAVMQRLTSLGIAPSDANLDIRGESPTIIEQLTGQTEIDNPALRVRCDRVRFLLRKFGTWGLHRKLHATDQDEELE